MSTLIITVPTTHIFTTQKFFKSEDKCFVEYSICHKDGDNIDCLEHKTVEVTPEQGNAHYKLLIEGGYRKVHHDGWNDDRLSMRGLSIREGETRCFCKRCNGHGIFFTGVHNGFPRPATPDHGVCWRCLGTGWEN